jgi:hypothetical protein
MIKHFRQGTGLLTESELMVEQPVPGGWRAVDTLDLSKALSEHSKKYRGVGHVVIGGLAKDSFTKLRMYIQGSPSHEDGGKQVSHPKSLDDFIKGAVEGARSGHPPSRFRVYVAGPTPDSLEPLINKALYAVPRALKDSENISEADIRRKFQQVADSARVTTKILAWIDVTIETEHSKGTRVKFKFKEVGNTVVGLAHSHPQANLRGTFPSADDYHLLTTPADEIEAKDEADLRRAVLHAYFGLLWQGFEHRVFSDIRGPVHKLSAALNDDPSVRRDHDIAHNRERVSRGLQARPQPTKPKGTDYDPTAKRTNKGLYGDTREIFNIKKEATGSKVVTSIPSARGYTNVVSAADEDRRWQRADTTMSRVRRVRESTKTMIPSEKVSPLVDTPDYAVIFGIHYDHPLISPKVNDQIYWYSNDNHFFSAVGTYSELTGDRPNIAYMILAKRGRNKGMVVPIREFNADRSPSAVQARNGFTKVIRAFWRHAAQGQKMNPSVMERFLGPGNYVKNEFIPENPLKETPTGVHDARWASYLKYVRTRGEQKLGLKFRKKVSWTAEGKVRGHQFDAAARKAEIKRRMARSWAGQRSPKTGKVDENWGVFLMEYIIGFTGSGASATPSFFVPLNVIRSKQDIPARETTKRLTRQELTSLLREHFKGHPVARAVSNWDYLPAHEFGKFPYARLMKRSVMPDKEDRDNYNKKLRQAGSKVRRTLHGFVIDGMEFEAWIALVPMPPSVADTKLGIINSQSYRRHVLSDPNMIKRIRRGKLGNRMDIKGMGLSPYPVHGTETSVPLYHKANQAATDVQRAGLVGKQTAIPAGHYGRLGSVSAVPSGEQVIAKWQPQIRRQVDGAGNIIARKVASFTSTSDPDQQERILRDTLRQLGAAEREVGRLASRFITEYVKGETQTGKSVMGSSTFRSVDTYIRYATAETDPGDYRIPEVIKRVGLSTWEAPVASHKRRTVWLSVKAPSEEVAKILIFYRLLRRSTENKELKKVLGIKDLHGNWDIFPDLHARLLTQWAHSGFALVEQGESLNTKFLYRQQPGPKDYQVQRAAHLGLHKQASILRTD